MPPYLLAAASHGHDVLYRDSDAICQQLLFGFFAVSESFFCLVNQFAQNAVPAEARDAHTAELIMQISGLGVDLDVIRRVTREETGLRLLEKHGLLRADQRGMERILEFTGHLCGLRRALLLDCVRDLIPTFSRRACRRGASTGRCEFSRGRRRGQSPATAGIPRPSRRGKPTIRSVVTAQPGKYVCRRRTLSS